MDSGFALRAPRNDGLNLFAATSGTARAFSSQQLLADLPGGKSLKIVSSPSLRNIPVFI
jgi:hypothetical protein